MGVVAGIAELIELHPCFDGEVLVAHFEQQFRIGNRGKTTGAGVLPIEIQGRRVDKPALGDGAHRHISLTGGHCVDGSIVAVGAGVDDG